MVSLVVVSASLTLSRLPVTIMINGSGTITGAAILGLVFLLGVPGNVFIIWSILARARHRSITTLLILNLAFADGFLMLLTPFFMVYLAQGSWIFGQTLCKILFYLCCANMYASIFLIMLMSLHRLVAIVWPKHVGLLTDRRTLTQLLAGLWVLALGLSVPVLVFRDTKEVRREPQSFLCDCHHPQPRYVSLLYIIISDKKKKIHPRKIKHNESNEALHETENYTHNAQTLRPSEMWRSLFLLFFVKCIIPSFASMDSKQLIKTS